MANIIKSSLDKYIFYYANNVLQMKKSQIEVKLNQKLGFKAQKLRTEIFLQELIEQSKVNNKVQDRHGLKNLDQLDFKFLDQVVYIIFYW